MIGGTFKREFYKAVYERRWIKMSFGRFVCIYGIGYVTMLVVISFATSIYLYRTYHDSWIRVIDRICSNDDDVSWIRALVRMVRNVLLWPVMIPRTIISFVHECEAEYNKLRL